jgi:FlaA1/EpsC-like NDP-sugar epimerase
MGFIALFLIPAIRINAKRLLMAIGLLRSKVLILGAGKTGQLVAKALREEQNLGYKVAGFLDDNPEKAGTLIEGIKVHLVKLPPGLSVEQAMDRFSHLPGVEFAEPNYILHIAETFQAEVTDQWGLTKIRTQEAWTILTANQKNEVLLATVDTGVKKDNGELSPRIWTDPNETPSNGIDDDSNGYVDDTWGWDSSIMTTTP